MTNLPQPDNRLIARSLVEQAIIDSWAETIINGWLSNPFGGPMALRKLAERLQLDPNELGQLAYDRAHGNDRAHDRQNTNDESERSDAR